MRLDTYLGAIETAAADAEAAEADGYDGAFTGEVASDPFLPLVAAAAATRRITLGTSIAVALARSPMTLAYTAYDLQRFSHGRLVLGLGSQVKAHVTRRFAMPWGRPAVQMRDYVHALRAIWQSWSTGEPLMVDSEHYRHTLMPPMFVPPPHKFGSPLVYLAGVGDAMSRVAGEVADGFLCHAFTTRRWIEERTLPALAEGRRRAGASMTGFTVKATVFTATGTDEQIAEALDQIRAQLAFYASTPAYRPVLELHGWDAVGEELTALSKQGKWQQMSRLIDDDMLEAFAVVAAPADLRARLAARCEGLVDRLSLLPSPPAAVSAALLSA